jgi:hypothetical protein
LLSADLHRLHGGSMSHRFGVVTLLGEAAPRLAP